MRGVARGVSRLAFEKSQLVGREKLETVPYLSEGNKQQAGEELTPRARGEGVLPR